ncbi:MAG TPA: hypothetical protein VMU61_06295 [Candidatus Aquilonibacter sp.]|nr:hypothetical protein [Candidatus Aquilonibacter sp.]
MQVLHNQFGVTYIYPGQTHYWWYAFDKPAPEGADYYDGDVGMCYAMPQIVFHPTLQDESVATLWATQQGLEKSFNYPFPTYGNATLIWHVAIQCDPASKNGLTYQLQIAEFEQ